MAVFGLEAIKRRLGQGNVGSTYQDPRSDSGIAARGANVYNGGTPSAKGKSSSGMTYTSPGELSPSQYNPIMTNDRFAPPGSHPGNKVDWTGRGTRHIPIMTNNGPLAPPGIHPGNKADWTRRGTRTVEDLATNVFDPQIEAIRRRMQESLAYGSSQRDTARQRVEQDYTQGQTELEKAREAAYRQLQANLASNGILRSGMNLEQTGELGENYQNSLSDLNTSRLRTLEDIDSAWQARQQEMAAQEEMLQLEQARINQQTALQQAQQEAIRQAAEEAQRRQEEQTQNQFINVTPTGQILPNEQRAREMTGAHGQDAMYYQDANKLVDRINQIFVNDKTVGFTAPGETHEQRIARLMDEVAQGRTLDDIRASSERIARQNAAKRRIGQ